MSQKALSFFLIQFFLISLWKQNALAAPETIGKATPMRPVDSNFIATAQKTMTLEEAFQAALQKNEIVGQAKEQVVQAEEQYAQAKSGLLPQLSFNATHLIQPPVDSALAREFFPEKQTTANLTLSQPLFRGFREFAAKRQRENLVSAQKQARLSALVQLYERVATSFLDVLALEQDLKNLSEQQALYSQRIKELLARGRRGESSSSEAITAQSTEAALMAEISLVQSRLKATRETFGLLTGLLPETGLVDGVAGSAGADKSVPDMKPITLKPMSEYLARVEERPDVKSAHERHQATQEEVSIAKGAHWPSADVIGNYYLKRPPGFTSDLKWDVTFRLTFPLFEGGLRESQVREAASRNRESEMELNKIRRQATSDIRTLYENIQMREAQLAALKRAVELSEKNYQVLQRDYRRGLTRNIDVQLALTEYRVSRRTYDQARYAAHLDLIRLNNAAAILPDSIMKEM